MVDIKPLSEQVTIIPRKKIEDSRGWFLKILTGLETGLPDSIGEIYSVFSEKGAARGGHYHKDTTEWFLLLNGYSKLHLKDIRTNELKIIELDSLKPVVVVVPPYIAHRFDALNNTPFLLIAYTNKIFVPSDTVALDF